MAALASVVTVSASAMALADAPPPPPVNVGEDGGRDTFGTVPGTMMISYLVGPDGSVSECKLEVNEGRLFGESGNSDPCPPKQLAVPRDAAGKPVARRYRLTFKVEVVDGK